MTRSRVTVTLDEDHLGGVQEVVEELRRRGMRVESVLEVLGMVTGDADDPAVLREVEGVRSVDAELHHDVGPPGSHVQGVEPGVEAPSDERAQPG